MARSVLLLAAAVAFVAGLVLLGFRLDERERAAAPCTSRPAMPIAGSARERTAGHGIWSAWLDYPPVAGETVTVLWRVEGAATPALALSGRERGDGALQVEYGPSPVLPQLGGGGFPWARGGREWGTRLLFERAGCWRVRVEAGGRRGELEVEVGG